MSGGWYGGGRHEEGSTITMVQFKLPLLGTILAASRQKTDLRLYDTNMKELVTPRSKKSDSIWRGRCHDAELSLMVGGSYEYIA